MTINQALKEKNKLVKQINECFAIAAAHNSIEEGNVRKYSTKAKLEEANLLTVELVALKTRIHLANAPVYEKIFAMAELKGNVNKLKAIPVAEGKQPADRWSGVAGDGKKEVELDVVERDTMVLAMEAQIEKLQDELDKNNATTEI